jgi:hypothetical protein
MLAPGQRIAPALLLRGGTVVGWQVAGQANGTVLTTGVVVANRLYAFPLYTGQGGTLDVVAINVTTGAAGNARIGVYSIDPATGLPKDLMYDSGNLDTTGAAVKSIDPNLVLPKNAIVWLAVVFSVTPTVRAMAVGGAISLGVPAAFGTAPVVGVYAPHVFAALPALFDAGGAIVGNTAVPLPCVAAHVE